MPPGAVAASSGHPQAKRLPVCQICVLRAIMESGLCVKTKITTTYCVIAVQFNENPYNLDLSPKNPCGLKKKIIWQSVYAEFRNSSF
jgi:hypothetical protein